MEPLAPDQRGLDSLQIRVNDARVRATSLTYNTRYVTIHLDRPIYQGDAVTLRYQPDTGADAWSLRDTRGNHADPRLSQISVQNGSRLVREPLTAQWTEEPERHNSGAGTYLEFRFSEPVRVGNGHPRDGMLQIINGTVTEAWPVNRNSAHWRMKVEGQARSTMVLLLPARSDCNAATTPCTRTGGTLSGSMIATLTPN